MASVLEALDVALLTWLRGWRTDWLDAAMVWASAIGTAGAVWIVLSAIGLLLARHRAAAWRVLLAVALSYGVVDGVLKPLIARPRPAPPEVSSLSARRPLPPVPRTYSLPSGHATSTFAAAVAVSRMWPQGRLAWWTLAVAIGYSRIYLGHHYPLDVLAGAALGIALALWVLGGRHPATYASTLPHPLPQGIVVRP